MPRVDELHDVLEDMPNYERVRDNSFDFLDIALKDSAQERLEDPRKLKAGRPPETMDLRNVRRRARYAELIQEKTDLLNYQQLIAASMSFSLSLVRSIAHLYFCMCVWRAYFPFLVLLLYPLFVWS